MESDSPKGRSAGLRGTRLRYGLAAAAGLVGLALVIVPGPTRTVDVGELRRVESPAGDEPAHPTAAFQKRALLLSPFIDLGGSSQLAVAAIEGASAERVYVRSAHRQRSFLIPVPSPEPLRWFALDLRPKGVRRHVQLAVLAEDASGSVHLRLAVRRRAGWWPWPLGLAALLLLWPRLYARRSSVWLALRPRLAPLGAVAIAAAVVLITTAGPLPYAVHSDEIFTVEMAERLLETGDLRLGSFKYPHLQGYLQAVGPMAYTLARCGFGRLAYHDPYTNRLYYDGQPVARERLFQPGLAARLAPEAIPTIRRGYACLFGVLVLLAYALAARVRSPRAGLIAALAVAVQPALRDSGMLPNMPGALLALAAGLLFLRLPPTTGSAVIKGLIAGLLLAWKLNPTFGVLLVALILVESPEGSRVSRTLLAVAVMPVGFWLAYPDLPWAIPRLVADIARDAYNYSSAFHPNFATDDPLAAALYQVHVRPDSAGNVALALLALVGAAVVALRFSWRHKWVLLWPVIAGSAFMLQQFLQFGRGYSMPLAYACLVTGIGGDALLSWAGRRWGRLASVGAGVLIVAAALQVLVQAFAEERRLRPTARSQAIAWIDEHAPLGARVILVESPLDELEGRQPDRARLQVRRREAVPEDRPGKEADFLVVDEGLGAAVPAAASLRARFTGAAVWGVSSGYSIYLVADQGAAPPQKPPTAQKAAPGSRPGARPPVGGLSRSGGSPPGSPTGTPRDAQPEPGVAPRRESPRGRRSRGWSPPVRRTGPRRRAPRAGTRARPRRDSRARPPGAASPASNPGFPSSLRHWVARTCRGTTASWLARCGRSRVARARGGRAGRPYPYAGRPGASGAGRGSSR
jgi:hypothetical protein